MMQRISLFLAAILISGSANAQSSNAAAYVMNQEITAACGGGGSISPSSFIETDLTGDGRADLLVVHEGIACSNGRRSSFCGAQVCSVHPYVREGDLLIKKGNFLGGGVRVEAGSIPTIRMHAHGGAPTALRWNGSAFEWQ